MAFDRTSKVLQIMDPTLPMYTLIFGMLSRCAGHLASPGRYLPFVYWSLKGGVAEARHERLQKLF